MKLRISTLAFVLFGLLNTGCVTRQIVAFQDHPTSNVTALEVLKQSRYVFFAKNEHIFYTCVDNTTQLVCKRLCGGNNDLVCPAGNGQGQSNVR